MFPKIFLIILLASCTSAKKPESKPVSAITTKEFSAGELILGTELLTKIFDEEMAPVKCVPDTDEAEILLRTIRPRMEIVQDDLEATLDNPVAVDKLIKTCEQNCTCGYVDELLREHLVKITRPQRKLLNLKKTDKELVRCLNYVQSTFCESELYKTLNQEKAEFTFEGET
jgi:predicted transcriptional regulator